MRLDDDGEEKAEEDGYVEAFKGVAIKVNEGSAAAPCTSVKELPWFPSFSFLGFSVPPFPSFLPGVLHCGRGNLSNATIERGPEDHCCFGVNFCHSGRAKLDLCYTASVSHLHWGCC